MPSAPVKTPMTTSATSSVASSVATTKARDPWFDNAKMALVTLVVIGHAWTLLPPNTTDNWLYDFLYAWHVPAFVLITGYLSKSFTWEPRRLRALVTTVAVPYVLFEGALALFRLRVGHEHLNDLWADPHWPMWYLSALFFWRLMTPIFKRIPAPVVVAVAISLVAGLRAGDTFDFARVFGLLPFFVVGLSLHRGHLELLRRPRARAIAVGVLATIFVLARFTDTWIATEWLYYRSTYGDLRTSDMQAATIRMVLLLVGLAGALAFLSLVPRRASWFTALGSATLVVYLWHGFFVLGAGYSGFPEWATAHPVLSLVVTTAVAAGLAIGLASPPAARMLNHAVDPIGSITRRMVQPAPAPEPARELVSAGSSSDVS
jgi:fucose 4-O-acetylase-like acetyltransferase